MEISIFSNRGMIMKHKKLLCISLTATLALSAFMVAACNKNVDPPADDNPTTGDEWHNQSLWLTEDALLPTEKMVLPTESKNNSEAVAVHDPSIFQDPKDGKYYAFGSHFAVAESEDLIVWEQYAKDNEDTKLFDGGVKEAMPETLKLAKNNTDAWAPDVEYYNGKYYMYISFTTAMYTSTSVISRVESDNVLGPYSNEKILIESVTSDESDKVRPNCIDPELFYDKNGGLWMVYGSFFGGIFIKELHNSGANWGLPKEDGLHDWGKLIWNGGYSAGVEGPFVFYNASTDYYYLMTSEDDLMSKYNMRIARSKTPDGPYLDVTGADVAGAGKGNKIAGNYTFHGNKKGSAALGHNSVIKDAEGRYFVIYHVRSQTGNKVELAHHLMVNELYFNEEGWPVMAPTAYVGEKAGLATQAEIAGDYEIVLHTVKSEVTMVSSEKYTLAADGTVTKDGKEAGSWTVKKDYYVEITLKETKNVDGKDTTVDVVYKGVVAPGWDNYAGARDKKDVITITAVSDTGRSLWAIPAIDKK